MALPHALAGELQGSQIWGLQAVTIGFSDAVGEILVSNPTVIERSSKFKFYS